MKYFALSFPVLALLAACATSPEPQYYTLSAVSGVAHPQHLTVKMRRPVIPATLDRPEMVSQNGSFRVEENETRLWSEPLDTMLERVLSEDLRSRLPHSLIVTESSEVQVKDAYVVDVEIQQFGTDAQGTVLQAQAVIRKPDGKEIPLPVLLHGAPSASAESMAKGLSALLAQFADRMAGAL